MAINACEYIEMLFNFLISLFVDDEVIFETIIHLVTE